jgi:hypothetical protein
MQSYDFKVTPYRIVNYTSRTITVQRASIYASQSRSAQSDNTSHRRQSSRAKDSVPFEYIIEPGRCVDYEVDYEEETKRLMRTTGGGEDMVNKQEFLKVIFEGGKHKIRSKYNNSINC